MRLRTQALMDRVKGMSRVVASMARLAGMAGLEFRYSPISDRLEISSVVRSYLRTMLEGEIIRASLLLEDVNKKVGWIRESPLAAFRFPLLYEELDRLASKMDTLSDLSSIDIRREVSIRDKVMGEIILWRLIHRAWMKPVHLGLAVVTAKS